MKFEGTISHVAKDMYGVTYITLNLNDGTVLKVGVDEPNPTSQQLISAVEESLDNLVKANYFKEDITLSAIIGTKVSVDIDVSNYEDRDTLFHSDE